MKIAQIGTPFERVPPPAYGGTERVISYLTEKLVERGHEVTLYATGDSITKAHLRACYPEPKRPYDLVDLDLQATLAYLEAANYDIIHNHTFSGLRCSKFVATPSVHTLHEVISDRRMPTYAAFADEPFISVSRAYQRNRPSLNYIGTVYNGVDTDELALNMQHEDYLLHMGDLSDHKGTHHAVTVAKRSGMKLILAGKIFPFTKKFFDEVVVPQIDGKQIEFIGEIGGQQRIEVIQRSRALLVPIEWEEPFGLIMAEAMSCGTPVIAFPRGSVPEVVVDGETGYIVDSVDEMIVALKKLDRIDPVVCRNHVLEKFSIDRMVDGYEAIYTQVLNQR